MCDLNPRDPALAKPKVVLSQERVNGEAGHAWGLLSKILTSLLAGPAQGPRRLAATCEPPGQRGKGCIAPARGPKLGRGGVADSEDA